MGVFPGFSGQKFIESTYDRCSELKKQIDRLGSHCLIEVDGGVTDKNASKLISCGADILVAGSYVFNSDDPVQKINSLKTI